MQRWLDTKPASATSHDYDEFAAEQNDAIGGGRLYEKPLRQSSYISTRLGVHFEDVVAVVRDGADFGCLRAVRQEALLKQTGGALRVIGARTAAAVVGHLGRPSQLVDRPEFPAPVLKLGGNHGWLLSDVEAFRDGRPIPWRKKFEMQEQVVGTTEMAELRGYPNSASVVALLHRAPRMLPEPEGRLDNAIYWLRTTVEAWLPTAPPRRRSRPVKKRHDRRERDE